MEDKIQQERRAAFEAALAQKNSHRAESGFDALRSEEVRNMWWAFNAALDCVVIELPPAFDDVHNYACYQGGWNDMRGEAVDAIESTSLGIKVK